MINNMVSTRLITIKDIIQQGIIKMLLSLIQITCMVLEVSVSTLAQKCPHNTVLDSIFLTTIIRHLIMPCMNKFIILIENIIWLLNLISNSHQSTMMSSLKLLKYLMKSSNILIMKMFTTRISMKQWSRYSTMKIGDTIQNHISLSQSQFMIQLIIKLSIMTLEYMTFKLLIT